MSKKYTSVSFSAYAVPTIPHLTGEVGDPDGPGYVSGSYVGLDDPKQDIEARVRLVAAAADQIYDMAVATRDDSTVLHVFLIPEFFFRGKNGAYEGSGDHELRHYGGELIRKLANQAKFEHWLFVCGSVIESDIASATSDVRVGAKNRDDLVQAIVRAYEQASDDETKDFMFDLLTKATDFAQSHPLVTVRNRCFLYKQNWPEWPTGVVIEKRFVSHEDFVVSYYKPEAYSEMTVAYPYVDESRGELKKEVNDEKSIFKMDNITFALEICLDHRRARLREVRKTHAESNVPVDVHLVVSCGMQIQQPSVVAKTGGLVFNCDGQYAKRAADDLPDDETSIFTGSVDGKAHSQMTVVAQEASAGQDAKLQLPQDVKVTTAPLKIPSDLDIGKLEAYGAGEVHLYSKHPLP